MKKSAKKVFKLTIEVTEETLLSLVTSGVEGGVRYWARITVGKALPEYRHYFTAVFEDHAGAQWRNGHPVEPLKKYTLSVAKLMKGLQVMQKKYPYHFANVVNADNADATTGDVLIQCALLGDIVYC
jgi:hypothetical protein